MELHDFCQRVLLKFKPQRVAHLRLDRNLRVAHFISAIFRTSSIARFEAGAFFPSYYVFHRQFLTWKNSIRRGVNLSSVFEDFAAEPPVDDLRIIVVIVKDDGRTADEGEEKGRKQDLEERRGVKVRKLRRLRFFVRLLFRHTRGL